MTLPENALRYDHCSLNELYRFIANRHIHFKFTLAQSVTRIQHKNDKQERCTLTSALLKADAAATIRFMELPPELRDQIHDHILTDITENANVTVVDLHDRMWRISPQFCEEARNVFKRGEYEILPESVHELSTPSQQSLLPAQRSPRLTQLAHSVALDPSLPRIRSVGASGQGESNVMNSLPSLPEDRSQSMARMHSSSLSEWMRY
jgi:hypothetical protein